MVSTVPSNLSRLVVITTAPSALRVLCDGQLRYFRDSNYEVIAVANPGGDLDFVGQRDAIETVGIPMEREMRPVRDLVSLWRMWSLMRRLRPEIVCAATAKASLLGLLAAKLARVPVRIYLQWGLRMETTRGLKRWILAFTEWLTAASAHRVFFVSESLRHAFIASGLARTEKTVVLMNGSSNGIDASRFERTESVREAALKLRAKWGIAQSDPVIGFVGRFVRDKGIVELIDAFDAVLAAHSDAWLVLVGDYESGDPVPDECIRRIACHPRIIRPGFVRELAPYYGTMSVLAFPSYREGFPNVVLEAGTAELPVVAFRATGSVDAVQDGVTGTIVDLGDTNGLAAALLRYLDDDELCRRHGQAGRQRALTDFRPKPIWQAMEIEFRELLSKHGRSLPAVRTAELSD